MSGATPRQRWGTCCPGDPACEHSYLDGDALTRWMDTPISDAQAAEVLGDWGPAQTVVLQVHAAMCIGEWNSDTFDRIAEVLRAAGFTFPDDEQSEQFQELANTLPYVPVVTFAAWWPA